MVLKKFPFYKQIGSMDCGPTCLRMLAEFYGIRYSLQNIQDECSTNEEGTSFFNLSSAAGGIGFKTISIKATLADLLYKIPLPVIIHWNDNHFVILYNVEFESLKGPSRISNCIFYVSDPAQGYKQYNIEEFSRKWLNIDKTISNCDEENKDTGFVMVIEPKVKILK